MQIELDIPFSAQNLSFWTPTKILYTSHDISRLSRIEQILVTFAELADKFCYLGSARTEFQPYSVLNYSGQEWIYSPITHAHKANFFNIVKKTVKIFALIMLAPITMLAFGAKFIYKCAFLQSIIKESMVCSPSLNLTDDQLRFTLKDLPNWIEDHFPENQKSQLQQVFPHAFLPSTQIDSLDNKTLNEKLTASVADFCRAFGSSVTKYPLMLRGLTLPTNAVTRTICMEIMISSWEKALSTPLSYAHCTNPITADSFECLKQAIARCPKGRKPKLEALLSRFKYNDLHIFNNVKMSMSAGPKFTISLAGQGKELVTEKLSCLL